MTLFAREKCFAYYAEPTVSHALTNLSALRKGEVHLIDPSTAKRSPFPYRDGKTSFTR